MDQYTPVVCQKVQDFHVKGDFEIEEQNREDQIPKTVFNFR